MIGNRNVVSSLTWIEEGVDVDALGLERRVGLVGGRRDGREHDAVLADDVLAVRRAEVLDPLAAAGLFFEPTQIESARPLIHAGALAARPDRRRRDAVFMPL